MFEPFKHVHMQKHVFRLFCRPKWTSVPVMIDKFSTTMPWMVDSNYFYPLFKWTMGKFFESGLYDRWDLNHDDINGVDNFYPVRNRLRKYEVNVSTIQFPVPLTNWCITTTSQIVSTHWRILQRLRRFQ